MPRKTATKAATGRTRGGRPSGTPERLTPELQAALFANIGLGLTLRCSAEDAGISIKTLEAWDRKGREGIAPYAEFHRALTRARASGQKSLHVRALGGGAGSSAAMWLLERRFPEEYGSKAKLELSGDPDRPVGGSVAKALDAMPLEELRARLDKLPKRK